MEAKKVIQNVQGIYGGQTTTGTLRLTDFHMVFCAPTPQQPPGSESDAATPPKMRERWLTYPILCYCALRPTYPTSGQSPSIRIRCRDFTFVTFNFNDNDVARDVFDFVKARTCKLGTVEKLFAFSHRPLRNEREVNGWELYDPKAEFRRQGISEKLPDRGWRITNINKDYSFCDSYPAFLAVPSVISDNVLKYARDFRSRNRIPTLSYIHPINNCAITRSSQPLVGLSRKTNIQDERLVAASFSAWTPGGSEESTPPPSQQESLGPGMLESTSADMERYEDELISRSAVIHDEKTGETRIYGRQQSNMIVDARPTVNAMANHFQGMGSEVMERYKFATKSYLNIQNIHVMSNSLNLVVEALKDADISPLPPNREILEKSGWLGHIQAVLDGSAIIARRIGINHSNVLIHCSDGWDRTSQLSALAQIMLDPYFRTIDGFIVLVEKDWLSFGHMFRLRSGPLNHEDWFTVSRDAMAGSKVQPGENDGRNDALQNALMSARRFFNSSKEDADLATATETASGKVVDDEATTQRMVSPIFQQFLDCVNQLVRQNPSQFEYNERLLRRLLYHLYSCQYGTFLYNSEKQRKDAKVGERTSSVWDYFLCRRQEFTNPYYDPIIDDRVRGKERILLPNLKDIRWWHQVFGRTDDEMNAALNAAAAVEYGRLAAVSNLHESSRPDQSSRSAPGTPKPTGIDNNQSVLTAVETAHQTLTHNHKQTSLPHHPSAEGTSAFSTIRDGISGLNIGKGMLGNLGRVGGSGSATPARQEQEMREMT
ncbi:phosphatidylinositol-3-phosphatase ymr1 [Conoideocrella luteorostrata]|uniref:Phosphatidylinositol-3-phosphatase ymr1 n=1 Tax=Conoideocrella luteorostrata TaxID=1105319 RepID=A0AAJ0FN03_9HYPO|nr:phosphatidylinositol-3-phosphatase ymr1 [Conoideocrella luteorostrata]